jgi:hypothetical protein
MEAVKTMQRAVGLLLDQQKSGVAPAALLTGMRARRGGEGISVADHIEAGG